MTFLHTPRRPAQALVNHLERIQPGPTPGSEDIIATTRRRIQELMNAADEGIEQKTINSGETDGRGITTGENIAEEAICPTMKDQRLVRPARLNPGVVPICVLFR